MEIDEFEKRILAALKYDDKDGVEWYLEDLYLWIHADGCLGASFMGCLIPCEGHSWGDALAIIVSWVETKAHPSMERTTDR